MRRNRAVVLLAAFLSLFAADASAQLQKAPQAVDPADEPFHSLILENDFVRVFRVEIPRFKRTELYRHDRDLVMIALAHGEASFARPNTMAVTREFDQGYTQFVPGGFSHTVANADSVRTLRLLEVELKRGSVKPAVVYDYSTAVATLYDTIPLPVDPRATYAVSHEAESVIGTDQQILPGESTPMHKHRGPHLVIALTDFEVENQPEGGEARTISVAAGEVRWIEALEPHRLKNVGKEVGRFISVEMK